MNHPKQTYYDELGSAFSEMMSRYDVARRKHLIFQQLLKGGKVRGKRILEVGCGTGCFTEELVIRGGIVTVLDIGTNLVDNVSKKYHCRGVVGDACNLPFDDASFDLVVSSECIEHTPDPVRAIMEMCRVCVGEGEVCFTSPNRLWYPVLWLAMKTKIRKFAGIENWLWPSSAAKVMKQSGMTDIELAGCHAWPFQIGFSQKLLALIDIKFGATCYPVMINYGVRGKKSVPVAR